MRQFMCDAEVGDEQTFEDPSVNTLQEMVAELLGKEAALFLPSGTMCNEIALRVHCRPGDEMIAHRTAHPIHYEAGGPAALAGVNVNALDGARGQYDEEAVERAIRPESRICRAAVFYGWSRRATLAVAPSGHLRGSPRSPRSPGDMVCSRTSTGRDS